MFRGVKGWLVALLVGFSVLTANAAVVFTVSPAAVSNTYNGFITLQLTGLNAGETVVIQKFLDANTNGVIGAGDSLIQQFNLTDGQQTLIGGAVNLNVPGDTDTVAGQITAKLSFQNGDFTQRIIGKYGYKISSPTARFAPITNFFSVTNLAYPQKITGTVTLGAGVVSNAVVILFPPPRGGDHGPGNPIAAVVANNAGIFSIAAPPGAYTLLAFRSNYVANFSASPVITLAAGATLTANAALIAANATISGKLVDSVNPTVGLPGRFFPASTSTGLIAAGFADGNGNFNLPVAAGTWKISGDSSGLISLGYVGYDSSTNVAAGATGVVLPYSKATALFYGTVKDGSGNPVPGIDVTSQDNDGNYNSLYQADGYSDVDGNYAVGVLGGLNGRIWRLEIGHDVAPTNYVFSRPQFNQNGGTTILAGQAIRADFTALLATHRLSGSVKDNQGKPIVGVGVYAFANINGVDFNLNSFDTDTNGNYSFNVPNGNWGVGVICQGGNNSLGNLGNYECPNNLSANIINNDAVVNFTILPPGSYQITGYIRDDSNNYIAGIRVNASGASGRNGTTDSSGRYTINVSSGNWIVSINCQDLALKNYGCAADQQVNISTGNSEASFVVQPCQPLAILTSALPDALVNTPYYYNDLTGFQLASTGCNPPFTWSLTPGSLPLPAGLALSTGGRITGAPAAAALGTNFFSVRLTDGSAGVKDQLLSIRVFPAAQITTASLPNATLGVNYSFVIVLTGGLGGSFGWDVVSGSLPVGLFLYGDGTIAGIPTQTGTFSLTVSAIDNSLYSVQRSLSITVQQPTLRVTMTSLPNATVGLNYSAQLQAADGKLPYAWSLALGSQPLPGGLKLSTDGIVSGIPSVSGNATFIVRVTDASQLKADQVVTLNVGAGNVAAPVFQPVIFGNNVLTLSWSATSGKSYLVQFKTDLKQTEWSPLTTVTANGSTATTTDSTGNGAQRFYRIVVQP